MQDESVRLATETGGHREALYKEALHACNLSRSPATTRGPPRLPSLLVLMPQADDVIGSPDGSRCTALLPMYSILLHLTPCVRICKEHIFMVLASLMSLAGHHSVCSQQLASLNPIAR